MWNHEEKSILYTRTIGFSHEEVKEALYDYAKKNGIKFPASAFTDVDLGRDDNTMIMMTIEKKGLPLTDQQKEQLDGHNA